MSSRILRSIIPASQSVCYRLAPPWTWYKFKFIKRIKDFGRICCSTCFLGSTNMNLRVILQNNLLNISKSSNDITLLFGKHLKFAESNTLMNSDWAHRTRSFLLNKAWFALISNQLTYFLCLIQMTFIYAFWKVIRWKFFKPENYICYMKEKIPP